MSYSAGQKLRASELNTPVVHMYQTLAQSVTSSVWAAVTMGAELVDSIGGHSTTVNTSRYTPNRAGYYRVFGQVVFAQNATGGRIAQVRKNGLNIDQMPYTTSTPNASLLSTTICGGIVLLNGSTDYIELYAYQDSGAALNTAYLTGSSGSYLTADMLSSI